MGPPIIRDGQSESKLRRRPANVRNQVACRRISFARAAAAPAFADARSDEIVEVK
jgi:hypothetical protein